MENTYTAGDVALNYFQGPANGTPLLLLHGSSSRWQTFSTILPELTSQFHVYAMDLRGHGKSGRTPGAYRIQDFLSDVLAFIKHQINQPAIVFGHSFGGMLGMMAAARHPELIKALIVGDSPMSIETARAVVDSQRQMATFAINWLRSGQLQALFEMLNDDTWATNVSQCDPDMFLAMLEQFDAVFEQYEIEKILPSVKCPTLIMRGVPELGSLITESDIQKASTLLPHVKHVQIPNAGHSFFRDNKESALSAFNTFMSENMGKN